MPGLMPPFEQPLYDTVQLAATAGPKSYTFFAVAKNGVLVGTTLKDYEHTNLIQPSMLGAGFGYRADSCFMYVREAASGGAAATLADYRIVQAGHLVIKVGGNEYQRFQVPMIPSGGCELNYFSNITAASTEFKVNRGINALSNVRSLAPGLEITGGEIIEVVLTIPGTIAAVTDVTFGFNGVMSKPSA